MLFPATPEQKVPGVPPLAVLERSGQLNGLGFTFDWGSLIETGSKAGLDLVTARYGVPQLQRGTMIQEGPGGQRILLAQPAGVPVQTPMPASTKTEFVAPLGTGLMVAGAAVLVVLVVVMTKGRGGGK